MKLINKEINNRLCAFLFAGILFLALVLRLLGISWGMPYGNVHPDEGIIFQPAYECALERSFEVHGYYYRPNHVSIKLNTLIYLGIQDVCFAPKGLSDFGANYSEHFALFTTASRVLSALFGVGVVVWVFLIGLFWGKKQALLASLFAAVFPGLIEHSHYITPDMPLLFFLLGVVFAALHYQKDPSVKWLFWMSFFTALATCEKYPGTFGCLIIAVSVISVHYKHFSKIVLHGGLSILFFILGIMAVSPVLIVDLRTVLEVMAGQNGKYHIGGDGLNFPETFVYYTLNTVKRMGLVLTLASIYGIIGSFKKNLKPSLILILFIIYILPISSLNLHWERYTLPIYTAGIMFGAFGILYFMEDMGRYLEGKKMLSFAAFALFILLPFGNLFASGVAVDGSFLAPDSRIMLMDTFAEMGITENNSVKDCNTPLDPGGMYGAWGDFEEADPSRFKWGAMPKYVVTSSGMRDLFLCADQEVYGWIADFYRALDRDYPMIFIYTPEIPSFHFIELQNLWYAARSVHRYLKGTASGYEIRVYQMRP